MFGLHKATRHELQKIKNLSKRRIDERRRTTGNMGYSKTHTKKLFKQGFKRF